MVRREQAPAMKTIKDPLLLRTVEDACPYKNVWFFFAIFLRKQTEISLFQKDEIIQIFHNPVERGNFFSKDNKKPSLVREGGPLAVDE